MAVLQFTAKMVEPALAEVAGALGVDPIVSGNVMAFGETNVVSAKLIDVGGARVLARASADVKGVGTEMLAAIRQLIGELLEGLPGVEPDAAAIANTAAEAEPEAEAEEQPTAIGPWLSLGCGVVAAAVSGLSGWRAFQTRETMANEVRGSVEWETHKATGTVQAVASGVLVAVAVGGVVGWILLSGAAGDEETTEEAALPPVVLLPVPGGAMLAFTFGGAR